MVPDRSSIAKAVVDQIVLIQTQKGHVNLLDFSVTLKDALLPDYYSWLSKLLEDCKGTFGWWTGGCKISTGEFNGDRWYIR